MRNYIETEKIKESLCIEYFEACLKLQEDCPYNHKIVSYKEVMPYMHIGRDRLQRVLNAITRNKIYFKLKRGYTIIGTNISSGVDWSKRFMLFDKPVYHFHVERFNPTY